MNLLRMFFLILLLVFNKASFGAATPQKTLIEQAYSILGLNPAQTQSLLKAQYDSINPESTPEQRKGAMQDLDRFYRKILLLDAAPAPLTTNLTNTAFRKLAFKWHSDRNLDRKAVAEEVTKIGLIAKDYLDAQLNASAAPIEKPVFTQQQIAESLFVDLDKHGKAFFKITEGDIDDLKNIYDTAIKKINELREHHPDVASINNLNSVSFRLGQEIDAAKKEFGHTDIPKPPVPPKPKPPVPPTPTPTKEEKEKLDEAQIIKNLNDIIDDIEKGVKDLSAMAPSNKKAIVKKASELAKKSYDVIKKYHQYSDIPNIDFALSNRALTIPSQVLDTIGDLPALNSLKTAYNIGTGVKPLSDSINFVLWLSNGIDSPIKTLGGRSLLNDIISKGTPGKDILISYGAGGEDQTAKDLENDFSNIENKFKSLASTHGTDTATRSAIMKDVRELYSNVENIRAKYKSLEPGPLKSRLQSKYFSINNLVTDIINLASLAPLRTVFNKVYNLPALLPKMVPGLSFVYLLRNGIDTPIDNLGNTLLNYVIKNNLQSDIPILTSYGSSKLIDLRNVFNEVYNLMDNKSIFPNAQKIQGISFENWLSNGINSPVDQRGFPLLIFAVNSDKPNAALTLIEYGAKDIEIAPGKKISFFANTFIKDPVKKGQVIKALNQP